MEIIGIISGLYRDNGKQHGNYCNGLYRDDRLYRDISIYIYVKIDIYI